MVPAVLGMRPRYVEKLWGGTRLSRLPAKQRAGHAPPAGVPVGEAWEAADLPEGSSIVDGGPLHGTSLREVVARFGRAVVGDAPVAADGVLRFPLLVKLIDAADDLSVQVHPGEQYARCHPGAASKDEAWLVIEAADGARVLHGTHDHVDAASFRGALAAGDAARSLREVRVAAGDVLRIEPGTLHAVGRGCLLLEVQEPSDTTFRVWDWGRLDQGGLPRALHVEEAFAVTRFGPHAPALLPTAPPGQPVVSAPRYSMMVQPIEAGARRPLLLAEGKAGVAFVLRGEAIIEGIAEGSAEGNAVAASVVLPAGASAVVCACARRVTASSQGGATIVIMAG